MARISVKEGCVVITPRGRWKVLGFCWRMRIPVEDVVRASMMSRPEVGLSEARRWAGTAAISGLAGYMKGAAGRSWWLYRYEAPALVIELRGGRLTSVVVDVEEPKAMAGVIEAAVRNM